MAVSPGLRLASCPLLKLQTAEVLRQLLRAKWGFQEREGCRDSPRSFAEWESSCEKAVFYPPPPPPLPPPLPLPPPPPPPLFPSSHPTAQRFAGHQPGQLISLPRPGSWKIPSMTNQNQVYLLCHRSFCEKHRPTQDIQQGNVGEEGCVLCCEDLSQASVENIQSPCCSQTIYHRKCIQVGLSRPWGPSTVALVGAPWECSGNLDGRPGRRAGQGSQRKVSPVPGYP